MSRNKKWPWIAFGLIGAVVFCLLYLLNPIEKSAANPSTISQPGVSKLSTSSASSSPAFMRPGLATSTLTLDTINQVSTTTLNITPTDAAGFVGVDQTFLAVQITGSSSVNSLLQVNWEFSNDGIDFYSNKISDTSSTTLRYSTTTQNLGGVGFSALPQYLNTGNPTNGFLVDVPVVPARYVRAVLSVPIGSLNSTNWAQFITRQEK